jgi:NAD(P)-dependent dehydrogenase (short-subunit alcohol dehydrogenase family)
MRERHMELAGQTALVTGATSGIGRAVALELARAGADVIVSGRDQTRGAETVAAITAGGGTARFVRADLGDLDSIERLAKQAGDVDVLVNNAGVFAFGPTSDQDVESFERMFHVNVRGVFFLTARLAPGMASRGGGAIVNVTTMAADVGLAGAAAYSASKAAVAGLTRSWAAEYAPQNIRVIAVSPGPTTTEGTTSTMGPAGISQMASTVPLNRAASVEEIAHVVAFAASPRASYITGAILAADGGRAAV